jgi:hypothetical protein
MMTRPVLAIALLLSAVACTPKSTTRADKPMVTRIGPNGYTLVSENDDAAQGKRRRVCTMLEITGSHVPKMVCSYPDDDDRERMMLQNDLDRGGNCRDYLKCDQGSPLGPGGMTGKGK